MTLENDITNRCSPNFSKNTWELTPIVFQLAYCSTETISECLNSLSPSDAFMCISKLTIIGSVNGLSLRQQQAIIWSSAGISLIGHLGTNVSEILIKIHISIQENAFENVFWKIIAISSQPQCIKTVYMRVDGV